MTTVVYVYYHIVKKFGEKAAAKDWRKNFGECWLALILSIAYQRLIVTEAIPKP